MHKRRAHGADNISIRQINSIPNFIPMPSPSPTPTPTPSPSPAPMPSPSPVPMPSPSPVPASRYTQYNQEQHERGDRSIQLEPNNYQPALEHYINAADAGNPFSAYAAANIFRSGSGNVPKDLKKAKYYMEMARNLGLCIRDEILNDLEREISLNTPNHKTLKALRSQQAFLGKKEITIPENNKGDVVIKMEEIPIPESNKVNNTI